MKLSFRVEFKQITANGDCKPCKAFYDLPKPQFSKRIYAIIAKVPKLATEWGSEIKYLAV
jgi:hypothetical protein